MVKKIIQIEHLTIEQLTKKITEILKSEFYSKTQKENSTTEEKWLTRQEVADLLSISIVTVDDWTRKKILTAYRIGNKKRFKKSEVESALNKI